MATAGVNLAVDELKCVCEKHRVAKLRLFGSVSRGEERADSDVDILVDYEAEYTPTFFSMSELEQDLGAIFDGRKVDLVRSKDLHWFIRRSVLSSAKTLYER